MAFAICQSNLCNACSPFADCKRYVIMRRITKEVVTLRLEPILTQLFLFGVVGLASNAILVVCFCFFEKTAPIKNYFLIFTKSVGHVNIECRRDATVSNFCFVKR